MTFRRPQTFDGLSLCSQRDPLKEANLWCDVLLNEVTEDHYWVVGLGAGYHVEELCRRRPKAVISVLEKNPELVDMFWKACSHLKGQVLIHSIAQAFDIFSLQAFAVFGLNFSPVLRFKPATQGWEDLASQIEKTLLGTTAESFSFYSRCLGFEWGDQSSRIQRTDIFNIKTVDMLFDGKPGSPAKKIVAFLRELVR